MSLGSLWASEMRLFKKIFDSITYYSLSQGVTSNVLSGFHNSPLISIHIIIQLSLLLYFSKYTCLRQYFEFPFILRDLGQIYQHVLHQLQAKSKKDSMLKSKKMLFLFILLPWLSNKLLWSINKLKQGLWYTIWLSYIHFPWN